MARVSIHAILRALIRGDRALLQDAKWVEQAVQVIDQAEAAASPAPGSEAYQAGADGTITPPGGEAQ